MVCIASSTGRMADSTRSFCEHQTPSGMPSNTEITTDTPMSDRVDIAGSHMSTAPQNMTPTTVSSASRKPPNRSPSNPSATTTSGQGRTCRKYSTSPIQ